MVKKQNKTDKNKRRNKQQTNKQANKQNKQTNPKPKTTQKKKKKKKKETSNRNIEDVSHWSEKKTALPTSTNSPVANKLQNIIQTTERFLCFCFLFCFCVCLFVYLFVFVLFCCLDDVCYKINCHVHIKLSKSSTVKFTTT